MNTVLSDKRKWSATYLSKLETHTNALAVNVLDNSKTAHRYAALTLPDRPQ
jgi:hypothetical protein